MSESGENQAVMNEQVPVETSAPKERVKKPNRPDDATHKQKTDALQAESKSHCFEDALLICLLSCSCINQFLIIIEQ